MSDFLRAVSRVSILLSLAFFLAACGPEKLIQWSGDGNQASLIAEGKLYLCDARGTLSGPLAENILRTAWLPGLQELVVVRKREISTWEDLVSMAPLGFDEKRITDAALAAAGEFLRFAGDLNDFKPSNADSLTTQQWIVAGLFLVQRQGPLLKKKLKEEEWKEWEELKPEVRMVQRISLSSAKTDEGVLLLSTLDEIDELRVAPDGLALAIVTRHTQGFEGAEQRSLLVLPAKTPGSPVLVANGVSVSPDWLPNGRDIFFFHSQEGQSAKSDVARLGMLGSRTVRDAQGAILREPLETMDWTAVLFRDSLKLRCTKDGRIIFAAHEIALPAATWSFPGRLTLFALQTEPHAAVTRLFPTALDERIPDRADLFELSPDERHLAIPGSKGRVSVVTVKTGEIQAVVDRDGPGDLKTVPVWRNSEQICLAVPAGSPHGSPGRAEIVLWSPGQTKIISRSWPDSVISSLK